MKQNHAFAEFSTVAGGSWEGDGVPPQSASWCNIPPQKAIDYWASKNPVIKNEWVKLSERERDRAFTAANIMEAGKLQQVYDIIGGAIKNGESVKSAKDKLLSTVDISDNQAETIVRTNVASAYSAGRYQEMTSAVKYRPYWKYIAIDDNHTRLSHLALNGKVYPADDPFWEVNYPPNGYKCRCDVVSVSERQIKASKIDVQHSANKPFILNKAFARSPLDLYKPVLDKYGPQVRQKYIENTVKYTDGDMVRLKRLLNQNDLELAESIMATNRYEKLDDVKNWIDKVYQEKKPKGEVAPMGNLPPKVLRFLKGKGIEPRLSLVALSDSEIAHMARDLKQQRGAALTVDEIKAIPEKFRTASTRWFYDKKDPAVLMVWIRNGNDYLKTVIRTDRKIGKGIANEITSGGKLQQNNTLISSLEEIK